MIGFFLGVLFIGLSYFITALPVVMGLAVIAHYLKRTAFTVRMKRFIFGSIAIFCLYPVILPFVVFGLTAPNIFLIYRILFSKSHELQEAISWNVEMLPQHLLLGIIVVVFVVIKTKDIFYNRDE
tara:strand:- start:3503 stop:3877 length:375 start_codon:yes stop_codon:yes gene_type:complete